MGYVVPGCMEGGACMLCETSSTVSNAWKYASPMLKLLLPMQDIVFGNAAYALLALKFLPMLELFTHIEVVVHVFV